MPSAAQVKKTAERAADAAKGLHSQPGCPIPQDYPLWDKVGGCWRNAACEARPNATGNRNQVRVQRSQEKEAKRAASSSSITGPSRTKRRLVADDVQEDPPQTTPRQIVRVVCKIPSANLTEQSAQERVFNLGPEFGMQTACTSDDCGLVGSQVLIPNRQWGRQFAHLSGSSKCTVVGYVDELRFPSTATSDSGLAPACIVRTVVGQFDYAFR